MDWRQQSRLIDQVLGCGAGVTFLEFKYGEGLVGVPDDTDKQIRVL